MGVYWPVQMNCTHEETRWEFKDFSNGEETWRCLDCGETIMRYMDSNGG